jgi:hypothetical protein
MDNESSSPIGVQPEDKDVAGSTEVGGPVSTESVSDELHAAVCAVPAELIASVDHTLEFLASSVDILDAPPFNFDDLT